MRFITAFIYSLISFSIFSISVQAALPLLGYQYSFNKNSFTLIPRTSEALFKNVVFEGLSGVERLQNRSQNKVLPVLLNALASADYPRWFCSRTIDEILSQPQFQSLKPYFFFDDELSESTLKCLRTIYNF